MPSTAQMTSRTPCGACEEMWTTSLPPASVCASTPRPSIGTPLRRPITSRVRSRRSAAAKTASVCSAVSPAAQAASRFPSTESHSCGAPSAKASCGSVTAGSSPMTGRTASAASAAAAALGATTTATGWPA